MVRVEHADAHCTRAREHGARILTEPTDFEYGERQYTAEDPAGHQWTFSETLADVRPRDGVGALVVSAPLARRYFQIVSQVRVTGCVPNVRWMRPLRAANSPEHSLVFLHAYGRASLNVVP